ncbi:MAG: F510_1955 family glycosylhydrolase [Mycolicibacterium sp.]|uniref:F510_1955 family glycosylhydrolase n=1 Tax=Mycolicibacterium sp. TaxID=2320850 RepID=UPI003D0E2C16
MKLGIPRRAVAAVTSGVLGLFVVALVGGCNSTSGLQADNGPAASSVDLAPALSHLHGLHMTAGGTLVAGTHTGLFAIDPATGVTSRVGDSEDDFMGLTGVAGSDTLYSSGHPGRSSSAPNPLGLRASVDGGQTWTDKSLVGQVDFHALAADRDILVGFDGTTGLRVSSDGGVTWSPGAALAARSLATTATGVWAITEIGLERSTDSARSFSPVPDAPSLVMIAAAEQALWGLDENGYAWHSLDGTSWQQSSYVGPAEALTAIDNTTAYAATNETLRLLS